MESIEDLRRFDAAKRCKWHYANLLEGPIAGPESSRVLVHAVDDAGIYVSEPNCRLEEAIEYCVEETIRYLVGRQSSKNQPLSKGGDKISSHEISFNTNLSDPPRTRADFTYNITPAVISITDTGLGSRSAADDIETILRKIEHWHHNQLVQNHVPRTEKDSGTEFGGTAKRHPFSL